MTEPPSPAGTLFVVATPIGNLEDITFRAVRTLREVDLIAAEDTRRTAHLLARYEIRKPTIAVHAHNEGREAARVVEHLQSGESVALVSDAGTPGISDPGAGLVRAARAARIPIVPIPGPSAVTAVLSVAGFPADQFVFAGFPPRSGTARDQWLEWLGQEPRLTVVFEAPHRIQETIDALIKLGRKPMLCARELTKIHEELVECSSSAAVPVPKGEFVLMLPPQSLPEKDLAVIDEAVDYFEYLTNVAGLDRTEALKRVSRVTGTPEAALKRAWKDRHYRGPDRRQPSS